MELEERWGNEELEEGMAARPSRGGGDGSLRTAASR